MHVLYIRTNVCVNLLDHDAHKIKMTLSFFGSPDPGSHTDFDADERPDLIVQHFQ